MVPCVNEELTEPYSVGFCMISPSHRVSNAMVVFFCFGTMLRVNEFGNAGLAMEI